MHFARHLVLTFAIALLAVSCKGAEGGGTGPGDRDIATLQCVGPTGRLFQCELRLTNAGGFEVELASNACEAEGNTLRLTKPSQQTLTANGCYETEGTKWTFAGPFPAGTAISLEVEAARLHNPPTLRVTGSYPQWRIEFEDGFDTDYDDMILMVRATS